MQLYHLAYDANLKSILTNGLQSASRLSAAAGLSGEARSAILRSHRAANVTLPNGTVLRQQRPMPPELLAPVLDDGLKPADWYALLNGFVYFWHDRDRLERLRAADAGAPQSVLVFDGDRLLADFGDRAFVARFNLGNARRRAVRRGCGSLVPYTAWQRQPFRPAEILIDAIVPTAAPYLVTIESS